MCNIMQYHEFIFIDINFNELHECLEGVIIINHYYDLEVNDEIYLEKIVEMVEMAQNGVDH